IVPAKFRNKSSGRMLCASAKLHTAVRRQSPRWVPSHLPCKPMWLGEIAGVTSPGCVSGWVYIRCPGGHSALRELIHFIFRSVVVCQCYACLFEVLTDPHDMCVKIINNVPTGTI